MATSEERMKILKMVQDGKITADQAAELLKALESRNAPAGQPGAPGQAGGQASGQANPQRGRWFRVRITDTDTGKTRVNVRMPLSVVTAGMKMGMRFSPEVEGMDISQLAELIQSGETGQIVDVFDEEDGEHVEVFVE
jgi:hypothetical protein